MSDPNRAIEWERQAAVEKLLSDEGRRMLTTVASTMETD